MLTTGEAATVIGFGTTRKRVIAMIADNEIAYVRPKRNAWARIPLSAALAKRRELQEALTDSKTAMGRKRIADQVAKNEGRREES